MRRKTIRYDSVTDVRVNRQGNIVFDLYSSDENKAARFSIPADKWAFFRDNGWDILCKRVEAEQEKHEEAMRREKAEEEFWDETHDLAVYGVFRGMHR